MISRRGTRNKNSGKKWVFSCRRLKNNKLLGSVNKFATTKNVTLFPSDRHGNSTPSAIFADNTEKRMCMCVCFFLFFLSESKTTRRVFLRYLKPQEAYLGLLKLLFVFLLLLFLNFLSSISVFGNGQDF